MTHSSPGRGLRAATVAACSAVLLLTGCEADPAPGGTPGAAPTAVAVPAVDPAPSLDWKTLAYRALGCPTRDRWVADGLPAQDWDDGAVRTTAADVTGDGVDEALVQVTCPAAVSAPADHVVVLSSSTAEVLAVLGDDLFHPRATLDVRGTTLTLSGPTVAGADPTCCPGHLGTVTYAWDGTGFVVRSRTEVPATAAAAGPALADGEHVGVLLSVGDDEVVVDVVEWFEGDAAAAACRADGVPVRETAWCTVYYARDGGQEPLRLPVSDAASLSYLDLGTMARVRIDDVAELAGTPWVSPDPDAAGYTRFRTEDGVVTALESIYTP